VARQVTDSLIVTAESGSGTIEDGPRRRLLCRALGARVFAIIQEAQELAYREALFRLVA